MIKINQVNTFIWFVSLSFLIATCAIILVILFKAFSRYLVSCGAFSIARSAWSCKSQRSCCNGLLKSLSVSRSASYSKSKSFVLWVAWLGNVYESSRERVRVHRLLDVHLDVFALVCPSPFPPLILVWINLMRGIYKRSRFVKSIILLTSQLRE